MRDAQINGYSETPRSSLANQIQLGGEYPSEADMAASFFWAACSIFLTRGCFICLTEEHTR